MPECVCVSGSPPPAVAFLEATNQVIAADEAASQNHSAITAGNIISLRAALFVTRTRASSLGSNESAAAAPTALNPRIPRSSSSAVFRPRLCTLFAERTADFVATLTTCDNTQRTRSSRGIYKDFFAACLLLCCCQRRSPLTRW